MSMNRRFTSHSPSSEGPERDTLPDAARVTPRADVTRPGDAWVYPGVGPSDAVLVRRVREGDTAAYAVLVARYRNRLGRYATHMLGDREDAEEAVQDAFVRGYRSLARCDDDERFGPWLFGILVNRCRTAGRRAARGSSRLDPRQREIAVRQTQFRQEHAHHHRDDPGGR